MKKALLVTLFAAVMAFGLAACGQSGSGSSSSAGEAGAGGTNETATSKFATMGDVFAVDASDTQWSYTDKQFDYIFVDGDNYVAVRAELNPELQKKLDEANFDNAKIAEVLASVPVARENTYPKPSDSELQALVGKTGSQLAAEGFEFSMLTVNGSETDCSATKMPFDYLITFEGAAKNEDPEKTADEVKDLTVKRVFVQGLNYQLFEDEADAGPEGASEGAASESAGEGADGAASESAASESGSSSN